MATRKPTPPAGEYLPAHAYANWLILAARVVLEPYRPARTDPPTTAAEIAADREAWQQWAEEKLRHSEEDGAPPARGAVSARRIGYMLDAEPDRSGARPGPKIGAELFDPRFRRRPAPAAAD